ncbi:hypothetical protein BGW37DRAFT_484861 [Umbelopsis sp. PMI_123]|nr:hypothetical protein BGW37DRAFT_484861 [Umbelopsis sp. PMI_123]
MTDELDFRSAMLNERPGHSALRRRRNTEAKKAAEAEGSSPTSEAKADTSDTKAKLVVFSICMVLLSWVLYYPYNSSQKLKGYKRAAVPDVGIEKCYKISGPSYCDDVKIHKPSGLAILSCDTAKAVWNPPFGIDNDTLIKDTPRSGEIWVHDMRLVKSVPKKLEIVGLDGAFHPLGMTLFPYTDPDQPLRLMVVNQANTSSSSVEVFEVKATEKKLVHLRTITDPLFNNLYRLTADPLQWNIDKVLSLPSFWVLQHHGYDKTDRPYRRHFEETLGLSAASGIYYNTPADFAEANLWYLSTPSSIAVDTKESSKRKVYLANSGSGSVEIHRNSFVAPDNQLRAVENKRTGKSGEVYWPAMIHQGSMQFDVYPYGIDLAFLPNDEEKDGSTTVFTAALPRYFDLVDIAKDSAAKQKVSEKKTGTRVYRSIPELRWRSSHRAVLPEERGSVINFDEVTFLAPVQKLIFNNDDGSLFSGATSIAVSEEDNKMILTGVYEEGFLICSL